jgi:hypothetical protein
VEVRPPKLARFADFTAPTVVHVRVPDVLDVGRLEALLMAPTQRTGK